MKRLVLVLILCLFVFAGNSFAALVGEFNPKGTISFNQQEAIGELSLHLGTDNNPAEFNFIDPNFDINQIHQFRFDWETSGFSGSQLALNSGSIFWTGSLNDFFERTYSPTLVVGGQEITLLGSPYVGFYAENGDGHVFQADFGSVGQINPIFLTKSDVSIVPIPAAAWLLGTGFVGLAALRRKIKK